MFQVRYLKKSRVNCTLTSLCFFFFKSKCSKTLVPCEDGRLFFPLLFTSGASGRLRRTGNAPLVWINPRGRRTERSGEVRRTRSDHLWARQILNSCSFPVSYSLPSHLPLVGGGGRGELHKNGIYGQWVIVQKDVFWSRPS